LVVDTNVMVSALLSGTSLPAHLIGLWRGGRSPSYGRAAGRLIGVDANARVSVEQSVTS
jgi:hypothetical protein